MSDRLLGTVLDGRYRIDAPLGAGAMGTVYRGVQISVGRPVAIKLVNPEWVRNQEVVRRFVREAVLTSQLVHPNAVSVLDFGQTRDGVYYLVMELLSGRTLEEVLRVERRLSPERVVRIGSQICSALISAHHLSILHRDLKPANIIMVDSLATTDHVKVVDFGIAKCLTLDPSGRNTDITRVGALLGTPAYMPPEVLLGAPADQRSDLYSLGCIMYELATGRTPYLAETIPELIARMTTETPPTPHELGVPGQLASIISALIAKNPAHRYMDAAHLRAALSQLEFPGATHMTPLPVAYNITAPPTPPHAYMPPPPPPTVRRRSAWPAVLACSLALALCAAALALGLLSKPAQGAPPAASTAAASPLR